MSQVIIQKIADNATELGVNNNFSAWTSGVPNNYTWDDGGGTGVLNQLTNDYWMPYAAQMYKSPIGSDVFLRTEISGLTVGKTYQLTFWCRSSTRIGRETMYWIL